MRQVASFPWENSADLYQAYTSFGYTQAVLIAFSFAFVDLTSETSSHCKISDSSRPPLDLGMFRLHPILERLILEPVDAFRRLDKDLAFAEAPQRVLRHRAVSRVAKLERVANLCQ